MPQFESIEHATRFREGLREQGFDGIAIDARSLGGPVQFIAFDPEQAIYPDSTPQFSRGEPIRLQNADTGNAMSADAVRRAVADDRLHMVSGPPINVVQSVSDLPDSIRVPAEAGGGAPQGVAHDGSVWLIADDLCSAQNTLAVTHAHRCSMG